jgi:hypothetical protein
MESLPNPLRGLIGIIFLLGIAYVLSGDRQNIQWRIVLTGILLQIAVVLLLKVKWNEMVFKEIAGFFVTVLGLTEKGTAFVFGPSGGVEGSGGAFRTKWLPGDFRVVRLRQFLFDRNSTRGDWSAGSDPEVRSGQSRLQGDDRGGAGQPALGVCRGNADVNSGPDCLPAQEVSCLVLD